MPISDELSQLAKVDPRVERYHFDPRGISVDQLIQLGHSPIVFEDDDEERDRIPQQHLFVFVDPIKLRREPCIFADAAWEMRKKLSEVTR